MKSPGSTASTQAARVFKPGRMFSHLMADSEEELRAYARSIKLPMTWIQYPGTPQVHFDVTGRILQRIMADDRVPKMSQVDWVEWYKGRLNP